MIRPWECFPGWHQGVSAREGLPATSVEAVTEAGAETAESASPVPPAYVGPLPRSIFTHFEEASKLVVAAEDEVLACLADVTARPAMTPWAAARELFGGGETA